MRGVGMRSRHIGLVVATALIIGSSGTAGAAGPSSHANCLGQANAGGANGGFVAPIASSQPGAFGDLARSFGTSGGAGYPASHNDCS